MSKLHPALELYLILLSHFDFFLKGAIPLCIIKYVYFIFSTVNTQHIQIPDVILQLGYTWRHASAVKRPSSGLQWPEDGRLTSSGLYWPEDGRLTAEACRQL